MTKHLAPTYLVSAYTVRPTNYAKTTHPDRERWCLTVTDAGDGWVIRRRNMCLNFRNEWEFEPPRHVRDAGFLNRCRFNEQAALLRARRVVDRLRVRGQTFAEFQEELRQEAAAEAAEYLKVEKQRHALQSLIQPLLAHRRSGASRPAHEA
jgi:hypothetical protein